MRAFAQQGPVDEQAKAIVAIPTGGLRIGPARAVDGLQNEEVVNDNIDPSRVTCPAADNADAGLDGTRLRVLEVYGPDSRGRAQDGNENLGVAVCIVSGQVRRRRKGNRDPGVIDRGRGG